MSVGGVLSATSGKRRVSISSRVSIKPRDASVYFGTDVRALAPEKRE
jgi:hypothetical protein